jgi:SNF2 family DNA or RNA helicase
VKALILQLDAQFAIELDTSLDEIYGGTVYFSAFKPTISNEGKTLTLDSGDDPLTCYQKLVAILQEKLGFQVEIDPSAQGTLQDAEKERQKFIIFSEKARKIRNDECDAEDFAQFKDSVASMRVQLKIFQLLAAYHLSFSQNACNFSVPGAGKTITVYGAYNYLKGLPEDSDKKIEKLMVIGPLSSFKAWKDDYEKAFGVPPKYFEIYGGVSKKIVSEQLNSTVTNYDLVLINYHSLNTYMDELVAFMGLNKTMLVLDEAHKIKKVDDGLWSTAAISLAQYPRSRVVLTGTPAPNGYEDIYNLYKFIWPSKDIIGYSAGQLSSISKQLSSHRVKDLLNRIEPFFVRITKKQLQLPEPTFVKPIGVKMGKLQQVVYDSLNQKTPQLERDAKNNPALYQSRLIRLRQAASNPNLLNISLADYYDSLEGEYIHNVALIDDLGLPPDVEEIVKNYREQEIPPKFVKTFEICRGIVAKGERIIIWCEFVQNIKDLSEYLGRNHIENALLYGGVDNQERESIIDRFHQDETLRVIIANPHAVGESISLHMACHNALYLEQSFNAATYMQSKDRIHRLGLGKDVATNYYFLHSIGTVDEVIYERVLKKEQNMIGMVESNDIPLFTNNANYLEDNDSDLKALIRHYYETTSKMVR